ncbi:restriction endonuclease subunit S [bacterium]|nr:restriction endonuclease subunit S [bacterium]
MYAKDLYDLEIPIPPIKIQEYIVSILDQFNNLISNLQDGIPAEIKLRNEQYYYYLKQLLSFNNQAKAE